MPVILILSPHRDAWSRRHVAESCSNSKSVERDMGKGKARSGSIRGLFGVRCHWVIFRETRRTHG